MSVPTDEEILVYEQSIRDQESHQFPLIASISTVEKLKEEYSNNQRFLDNLTLLEQQGFKTYRRSRGDGNCFFRAFSFMYYEHFLRKSSEQDYEIALSRLRETKKWLLGIGYQEYAFEDFYDMTMEYFENFRQVAESELINVFQQDSTSNAIVVYFRLITSAFLQMHADDYFPFVMDQSPSMEIFCQSQVEAFGKDADQVHIIALASALKILVKVAYLDASESGLAFHEFGVDESNVSLALLYRPGHYDMLYKE